MAKGTPTPVEASLARARTLVGLKGYVTNIGADIMAPGEVTSSDHDQWHVEQSFRKSKTDLRARPIFHRTRDAIDAHLTIVFAALAVARTVQQRTGLDHPQRHPATAPAALSDHRHQRRRTDFPTRHPHRETGNPRRHHQHENHALSK